MRHKPTLSLTSKQQAYSSKKGDNFVESMRLEGYSVDKSLLSLSVSERKAKKEEILEKYSASKNSQ
ncbi:YhfG family protein [Marinomonas polaris]|uniref:YhfG family protein n=1 Tax=Marinomonas polaris TaxID=293552 RepID=UPI003513D1D2